MENFHERSISCGLHTASHNCTRLFIFPCAGNAGLFRLTCGDELVCFLPLHTRLRVRPASGIPCALFFGADVEASLGHFMPRECGIVPHRHCERSEAIHRATSGDMDCFVASLLAMTRWPSSSAVMPRLKRGIQYSRGFSLQARPSLEYWIARSSRATTASCGLKLESETQRAGAAGAGAAAFLPAGCFTGAGAGGR